MKTKTIDENRELYESISRNELRQLLFWANEGVKQIKKRGGSGSYWETIEETIWEYAKLINFKL